MYDPLSNRDFFYNHRHFLLLDEYNKFGHKVRDVYVFRDMMDKIMNSDKAIDNYIFEKKLDINCSIFKEKILFSIATCVARHSVDLLEVLFKEYNVKPDASFINYIGYGYMNTNILVLLNEYIDLKNHFPEIKQTFWSLCGYYYNLETLINMIANLNMIGFDISDFCDMQNCQNYNHSLLYYLIESDNAINLKYFLDNGFSFKKYQEEAITYCINGRKTECLRVLIDYGIDLTSLEKINIQTFDQKIIILYDLLTNNNIDPKLTALLISKNKN